MSKGRQHWLRQWAAMIMIWMNVSLVAAAPLGLVASSPEPSASTVDSAGKELDLLGKELDQEQSQNSALQQEILAVKKSVQSAPDLATNLRLEIQRLEGSGNKANLPTRQDSVEAAIDVLEAQAHAMQQSLADVLARIGDQQALPGQSRQQVKLSQQQAEELQGKIDQLQSSPNQDAVKSLQLQVYQQRLDNVSLRKSLAQNRLDGYQKLLDLYTVNRDLLFLQMDRLKSALEVLRGRQEEMRLQTAGEHQDNVVQLQGNYEKEPALLTAELAENKRLQALLVSRTEDLNQSSSMQVDSEQELQDIRYRFEVARQQLDLTEFFQYVDDYLLRQRQVLQVRIREQEVDTKLRDKLSRVRLQQFKLDEQLHNLRTDTARRQYIGEQLLDKNLQGDAALAQQLTMDLARIYESRSQTLTKLVEVNAAYVVNLTNLELLQGDQLNERRKYYELLNKKLFWRRSAAPLDWDWLTRLPGSVRWFVMEQPWRDPLSAWFAYLVEPVFPLLFLLLLTAGFVALRKKLLRRLKHGLGKIGNVSHDRFRYTLEALLTTVVLALPAPVMMLVLAQPLLLGSDVSTLSLGMGAAFMVLSHWMFLFEFLRQLVRPNGLAEGHFRWRPSAITALRRWVPLLYLQLPGAFVFILVWREGSELHSGILGRAAFLLVVALFVLFCARLLSRHVGVAQQDDGKSSHWYQRWNRPLFWVFVLTPSSLLVLSMAGYSFSAMEVLVLMYQTMMYGFFIFIAEQVVMRWFAVLERKFAYARAIEKRDALRRVKEQQEAAEAVGEPMPEVEIPTLDVAAISEQNRTLLRVVFFSLFALVCYWSWQDFFQAIQVFQEVDLWTYTVEGTSGVEVRTVTLETLLGVLVALVLTYVGVKNLPGLIEVLILQRLKVDAGIRFAITTTARYLVIAAGVMIISSMVGMEWEKLGWLVAALGVGLGFGLQEIFANFISGLIILFERPIRIGDAVTINELSGIVTQIRMRATTITDWDQKELIIPNKTFVTNQFINWTLSDTTTRVVIKVGVAYGSDTKLVTKTLLEVAQAHQVVLKDPAPSAFFLGFGSSSLDFELRGYVASFSQRLVLIHDLHTAIDLRFRELGIEIAFPQLDLHVKHLPGTGDRAS